MVFLYTFLSPVATTTLALLSELLLSELDSDDVEEVPPLLELVVDELSVSEPSDSSDARRSGRQSSSASLVGRCVPYLSPPSSPVVVAYPMPSLLLVHMNGNPRNLFCFLRLCLPSTPGNLLLHNPTTYFNCFRVQAGMQGGYVTPAVSGIPTASERGDKIRKGPLVGKMATSPLPSRGSPALHSGGTKSEVAYLWAKWLRHPCRLGDPHRFRAGGQNQKWPTCGQNGYVTSAVSGIPTASKRGAKSEVAHKWSKMLYSGSVRCAKQTLPPKKGGGFGYVKTLLLPKILANEKRGGVM